MKILALDPSINHTGFAYFENKTLKEYGTFVPDAQFCKGLHWTQRAYSIFYKYCAYFTFQDIEPDRIVIEFPEVWHGTLRAHTAKESGALEKLFFMVGLLCAHQTEKVVLITPSKWKGQVPKEVTRKRVLALFPSIDSKLSQDAIDAIGLGHYYLTHEVFDSSDSSAPTEFEREQAALSLIDPIKDEESESVYNQDQDQII